MAVIDAAVRLLPGVLGDEDSAVQDSFVEGLLDYPHYTRPEEIEGRRVPAVLYKQALGRSFLRRPDLVKKLQLGREQQELLDEFLKEQGRVT
jgi:tRNA (guanine37-N1)-methyltransferase